MRVALTFDADMTAGMRQAVLDGEAVHYDRRIISLLRQTGTRATIFVTGLWAETYPDEVRSFAADPLLEIANHSWDHRAFRSPCYGLPALTSDTDRRRQINRAAASIRRLSAVSTMYFRYPGGCHGDSDVALVREESHVPVQWDVISGDPFQDRPSVIVRNVLSSVNPGSIIVFHLNGSPNAPGTYAALRSLVPELKSRGYEPVTLTELLKERARPPHLSPATPRVRLL